MVRTRRFKYAVRVSNGDADKPVLEEKYEHAPSPQTRYPTSKESDSLFSSTTGSTSSDLVTRPSSELDGSVDSKEFTEGDYKKESTQASAPKEPISKEMESAAAKGKPKVAKKDLGKKKPAKANPEKNMATSAAISSHRNDRNKYPLVEYRIPKSREFNEANIKLLNKIHPCKLSDLHSYAHSNEHPLCAAARSIGEAYILNEVLNTLADHKLKPDYILDVGGAGRRHINMKRRYVWSCIPTQSAKDVLRRFTIPPGQHCEHSWSECKCHDFPISMSVHAIYYMSPQEIFDNVVRQAIPLHYALLHRYVGDSGSLMDGEMTYVRQNSMLYVKANGNIHHYVHPTMDWLNDGVALVNGGTLVWEKCRSFLDSEVLRFHAVKCLIPLHPKLEPVPQPVLCVDDKFETSRFDEVVNQCILPHKEINTSNRSKYLESVRRKGLANGLDVVKLVKYADEVYMAQEAVVAPVNDKIQTTAYERLVRLRMLRVTVDYVLPVVILTAILAVLAGEAFSFDNALWALVYGSCAGVFVIVCAWVASRFKRHQDFDVGLPKLSFLDLWNERFANWKCKAKVTDYCCQMADKPTDKRKLVKLKVPDDYSEECHAKDAAYAMVYSPKHAPYFPRNCSHNVVSSIKNKLGQEIPGAGKYSFSLHPLLERIAKEANGTIQPLDWESWVSRFPGPKQARLRKEYSDAVDDVILNWNESKFFTKFEAYPEPKYPRPILSSIVHLNFAIGRWLIPLAEFLADALPDNFLFPLHGDSNEIGEFRSSMSGNVEMDCDFSSFDSSQDELALEIVFTFLELAGVPKEVVDRCRADKVFCVIRNRKGLKVIMKGCRFSGRSETLLGNSLVTLNTALHIFGVKLVGAMVKGDDTTLYLDVRYEYDVESYKLQYLGVGLVAKLRDVDDYEVEFCSSIFVPTIDSQVLVVKPGKLLAKTFWCKNLEYGPEDMEKQFASILKGLANTLQDLPGIRGLYRNPVYLKWFGQVEAHYDMYNEYASRYATYGNEAISFLCERYQITAAELAELEVELSSSFPVRLESLAAISMIEKDWSASNDGSHLTEIVQEVNECRLTHIGLEELFCFYFPYGWLLLGLAEFWMTGDYRHVLGHLVLHFVRGFNPLLSFLVHTINNCFAGTIRLSVIMANRRNKAKKKTAKKTRVTKKKGTKTLSRFASMVADPCNSELVPGVYGDSAGIVARFKASNAFTRTETSGFFLWCPTGSTKLGGNPEPIGSVIYTTNDPTSHPSNTNAVPFARSDWTTGGVPMDFGANNFKIGSTCSEYRVLSACMRLLYTGETSSCKGRVAFINGLPTSTLVSGSAGVPMSVNDLFAYSGVTERISLDAMENRYRPISEYTKYFKNDSDAPIAHPTGLATVVGSDSARFGEVWFGFAWTGLAMSNLVVETIENLEWKPDSALGFAGLPTVSRSSRDYMHEAVAELDRVHPGWQSSVMDYVTSAGMQAVKYALGGSAMLGGVSVASNRLRIMG
jgi:hypothetical protein